MPTQHSGTNSCFLCSGFNACFEVLSLLGTEDCDKRLHSPETSVLKHLAFSEGTISLPGGERLDQGVFVDLVRWGRR